MQRRTFIQALFGGIGSAAMGFHLIARNRTTLIQESPVAGFQFYRGEAIWSLLGVGNKLSLVREPSNSHDCDAVAVYFGNDQLGYIPQRENCAIAQMLDRGENLETRITKVRDEMNPWRRIRIGIFRA